MEKTNSYTTKTCKGFGFGRNILRSIFCCIMLWAAGTGARAQTYNINSADVTITATGTYYITGTGAPTTHRIAVSGSGITATIYLNNVNIDVSQINGACAFDIAGATVNLTLAGDNILKSGEWKAGLQVPNGAILAIDGTGSLTAYGNNAAGIGGTYNGTCGDITIKGGTVTATGGYEGAGIGGSYKSTGGSISITGGTVTANSGTVTPNGFGFAAGIGGGSSGNINRISINGGTVTANGGNVGVGIGGGYNGTCGDISISGGTVTANVGNDGAGIGGSQGATVGSITISGGTIKATGNTVLAMVGTAAAERLRSPVAASMQVPICSPPTAAAAMFISTPSR